MIEIPTISKELTPSGLMSADFKYPLYKDPSSNIS